MVNEAWKTAVGSPVQRRPSKGNRPLQAIKTRDMGLTGVVELVQSSACYESGNVRKVICPTIQR
jgi:hypothetical protein